MVDQPHFVLMFSPGDFAKIDVLSAHVNLWMLRHLQLHWHRR